MAEAVLLVGMLAAAYVYVANKRWNAVPVVSGTCPPPTQVGAGREETALSGHLRAMLGRRESSRPLMSSEPMEQEPADPTPLL